MTSLRDCSRETHKFSTYPTGTKELWKWQLNVTEKATNTTVYTIALIGSVRIATNPYGWDSLRPVNISLSPGLSVEDIEDSIVVGFKKNDWNFVVESYQTPRSGEDAPPKYANDRDLIALEFTIMDAPPLNPTEKVER